MNCEMTLESARQVLDLSVFELWVAYFALGGLSDAPTLDAYLRGDKSATELDHNLIAQALNETFAERHQDPPVPYRGT